MEDAVIQGRNPVLEVIKAVIVAIIISLLAILAEAFLVTPLNLTARSVTIINQVIKGLSILIACLICLKSPSNGWIKGIVVGLLYIGLAFLVFSLLDNQFKAGLSLLNDVALGAVSGMLSGIIAVSMRK